MKSSFIAKTSLVLAAAVWSASSTLAGFVLEFSADAGEPEWVAVNDGVMGGLSQGGPRIHEGVLYFKGTLSLENNGGFSSVRTKPGKFDLSSAKAMVLRVKGDGRIYQLRLSTDARHRGSRISYGAEFSTKAGEWIEVKVPFDKFVPTHHGNVLSGPPIDLAKVEEIGLLLGDGKAGEFELNVEWMKAE
jgi:NADH dehydrogenase [ubiquinone] 1 alpha subcomplex assembly factor 1